VGAATGTAGTAGKALRVLAVAALTFASTGALAVPAAWADTANPVASKTNWWWSSAAPSVNGTRLPAGAPEQASGVPVGDLGVGYVADQAGTSDKVAAVALDLTAIPLRSTFSSFVLSVPYDAAAHQLADGTPDISACEIIAAFPDGPGPSDFATVPPVSQPSCVKGTYKPTVGTAGGYVFDLTAIANDWSGGAPADGVLLEPTPGLATPQQPFSLAFLGNNGITSQVSYSPPVPPSVDQGAAVPPPSLAPAPSTAGFVSLPNSAPVPVSPPAPVPVAPVPAPQVNPAPTVAPPVAAAYVPGALVPSTMWWLGLLGVLVLLGLTALVLGDPMAPVVVDGRRRRFAQAIRAGGTVAATPGTRVATARNAHRPRPA